jgi:hypothetical protein
LHQPRIRLLAAAARLHGNGAEQAGDGFGLQEGLFGVDQLQA